MGHWGAKLVSRRDLSRSGSNPRRIGFALLCLSLAIGPSGCGSEDEDKPRDLTVSTSEPAGSGRQFISDEPRKTGESEIGEYIDDDKPVLERQELEDGLVVEDLRLGEGMVCPPGASVVLHYYATLEDGEVVDSTWKGDPAGPLSLSKLIPGWRSGVPGMRVGGVRRLKVPYQLAYGEEGSPPSVPPKADMTFVIELLEVRSFIRASASGARGPASGR
jgi:FKBP-type peptidyl-prolyl cis-trans isomerase